MTTENARKSYDEYTDLGEELEYALRDTQALRAEIERLNGIIAKTGFGF